MTTDEAARILWDYNLLNHELEESDIIMLLGHHDLRVPRYAATLYHAGLAPLIVCSGSGTIHRGSPLRTEFNGATEAEVFREVLLQEGVPDGVIILEDRSQNTGQNYQFTDKILKERGISLNNVIAVQKPYMERRTYATGKVWWPNVKLMVTSPNISYHDYPNEIISKKFTIDMLVGDVDRIIKYPAFGFQIVQEVPDDVVKAYKFLIEQGYNNNLVEEKSKKE